MKFSELTEGNDEEQGSIKKRGIQPGSAIREEAS